MNNNLSQQYKDLLDDIKNIIGGRQQKEKLPETDKNMEAYVKILSDLRSALAEEPTPAKTESEIQRQIEDLRQEIARQEKKGLASNEIYSELIREIKELKEEINKKPVGEIASLHNDNEVAQNDYEDSEEDEHLEEILAELPEEIRRFLSKDIWRSKVKDIGEKNNLSREETDVLQRETYFILTGLEPLNDFIENLQNHLKIDKELAEKIATEIGEKIFAEVEDSLVEINNNPEEDFEPTEEKLEENKGSQSENIGGIEIEYQKGDGQSDQEETQKPDLKENEGSNTKQNTQDEPERDRILREIENPVKAKININKKVDPYREPIE